MTAPAASTSSTTSRRPWFQASSHRRRANSLASAVPIDYLQSSQTRFVRDRLGEMARPVNPDLTASPRRPYRSVLRAEQAKLTRSRILDAAESLFLTHGYGATTIAAIAEEAGVAVDTVYGTFGSKKGVLKSLMDVRVVGDDEAVPLLQRDEPKAAAAEADQHRRVEMVAAGIAAIHERTRRIDTHGLGGRQRSRDRRITDRRPTASTTGRDAPRRHHHPGGSSSPARFGHHPGY